MSEKKNLLILITITVLTAMLSLFFAFSAAAFASDGIREIPVNYVTDVEFYANLNRPELVASNGVTIMSVSGNRITNVTDNRSSDVILDDNYAIIDVALSSNAIFLLAAEPDTVNYKLYIGDYNFNLLENISFKGDNSINENSVVDVFNTNTEVFIVSGLTVYSVSADVGSATITATAADNLENKNNLNNISVFDGEYYSYFYTLKGISKFDANTQKFTKKYAVDVRDYVISDGNLYYLEGNSLVKRSDSDEVIKTIQLDFTPNGIYLHNGSLLITAPNENKIYNLSLSLDKITDYYGDSGNGANRLNTPTDIATYGKNVYVADSKNDRIFTYSVSDGITSEIALNQSPLLITASKDLVAYMAKDGNKYSLYKTSGNNPIYSSFSEIINIESSGNVIYALTASGDIISVDCATGENATIISAVDSPGIKSFETPEHSAYMYYSAGGSLYKYNLQTGNKNTVADISVAGGFAVDYNGNIFQYDYKAVTKNGDAGKLLTDFGVNGDEVISYKLCNTTGNFYAVTKNHRLFELSSESIDSKSFDNDRYDPPTVFDIIKLSSFKADASNIIAYVDSPNNIENTRIIDPSERFIALAKVTENGTDYYYVCNAKGNQFMYIEVVFFNELSENPPTDYYVSTLSDNVNIYRYPFQSSEVSATLKNNVKLLSLNILTDNINWNWHYVTYTENESVKKGYIKANDVSKVTDSNSQFMQLFKVKADKIGHKVKIYSKPSLDSKILFDKVNDGEELHAYFIDTNAEFTRVYYKDTYGYVLSGNLIKNTLLTPNQILAICVSVGSAVALAIIIVIAIYIRKRKKINIKLLDNNV